jgi:hypothetical protein
MIAIGVVLLVLAMFRWHTATLACDVKRNCTLTRVAVASSERIEVVKLRGAEGDAKLVLRATPDVEMGPHAKARHVPSYARAAERIEAWLKGPPKPLEVSVPNRNSWRMWGIGGVLAVIGLGFVAAFAIGSRVRIDAGGEFWRHGSRLVHGKSDDITAVHVKGNFVMVKLRDGRELPLLATLSGRKQTPPRPRPDLEEVAAKIRQHLRLR